MVSLSGTLEFGQWIKRRSTLSSFSLSRLSRADLAYLPYMCRFEQLHMTEVWSRYPALGSWFDRCKQTAGYRNGMIKYGDSITVFVAPLKDGSEGGYVTAAKTASGTSFGALSRAEQEQERQRAECK